VRLPSDTVSPIASSLPTLPGLTPVSRESADGENRRWLKARSEAQGSDQREPQPHAGSHDTPAAVTPASPTVVYAGCRIRFLGRTWIVERVNHHAGHGPLLAISAEDDDSFELICGRGCDGPFEVLPACEVVR
jgi:hypothetical protein